MSVLTTAVQNTAQNRSDDGPINSHALEKPQL